VVITKHALRNALIPTVTVIGLQIGMLLGGNMITRSGNVLCTYLRCSKLDSGYYLYISKSKNILLNVKGLISV